MAPIIGQRGSVMYLAGNHQYMGLRHDGSCVLVPGELIKREFVPDDIVEFDADIITPRDAQKYSSVKPKWLATRIKFVKHAQTIEGVGKVLNIDPNGEYCFLDATVNNQSYNVFCTRINLLPEVKDIHQLFSVGSSVRFVAKEQVPSIKNNNVRWRTVAATDMKHELKANVSRFHQKTYDATPVVSNTAKPAPKSVPVKVARPAPVQNAWSTGSSQVTAPSSPATTPSSTAPPSVTGGCAPSIGSQASSVNSSRVTSPTPSVNGSSASVAPSNGTCSTPPPSMAPLSLQGSLVNEAPAAQYDREKECNHPMASFQWMKFDLINTLQNFPKTDDDEMKTENQKLRAIAHHLSDNVCSYCLSH